MSTRAIFGEEGEREEARKQFGEEVGREKANPPRKKITGKSARHV
jgi:hypothetical protein